MSLKISIAMATYNGAEYIKEQLISIAGQTRLPDELVITDDGSNDDTLEIIRQFAETAPFAVIYTQNNKKLGYGHNFNAALSKTTGDLVFLCDQDDVWFSNKIEFMSSIAASQKDALALMNDALLTDAELNETNLTKLGQIRDAGFKEHKFIMGCCSVIKRELLDYCLPIPETYPTHDDWILGIADGLGRKHIVKEVLQYYRRHGKNESQSVVNQTTNITRWHVVLADIRQYFSQKPIESNDDNIKNIGSTTSQKLLLHWADTTAKHAPDPIAGQAKSYYNKLSRKITALHQRNAIKKLRLPRRCIAAFDLWRVGGYREFSGFQTTIRDILLP